MTHTYPDYTIVRRYGETVARERNIPHNIRTPGSLKTIIFAAHDVATT